MNPITLCDTKGTVFVLSINTIFRGVSKTFIYFIGVVNKDLTSYNVDLIRYQKIQYFSPLVKTDHSNSNRNCESIGKHRQIYLVRYIISAHNMGISLSVWSIFALILHLLSVIQLECKMERCKM